MSAPVELIELKRSANVREQTRAVKKFHDILLGLVSKVYLDTLHFKGMVEGGNPPLPEELGSLVEAYDKANNMWNHIGKLKVSWATNVGSKAEYPALKDEDFNRQRLDIAQDFLNEQVEVHRRRVSQAETGYGDSGPIASTRPGADSFVDTMISTIRASFRDPGEGAVGNDSFTIPVPPIVSSSSAITSGPIIESAEQGDASGNVDPNRYNISISGFKPSIFTADGPPRTSISDVSSQVNTAIISTASSKTVSHVNVPSSTKNSISVTTASSSGTSSTMTVASHTTPSSATIPISSIGLPSNSGINAPAGSSNTGASDANEQGSNEPPVSNENNNSGNTGGSGSGQGNGSGSGNAGGGGDGSGNNDHNDEEENEDESEEEEENEDDDEDESEEEREDAENGEKFISKVRNLTRTRTKDNHPSSSDGDDEDDDRYNRPPIGNPFPSFMNRRNRFNSSTPHPNRKAPVNPLQPDQPANLAQPRQLGFQVPVPGNPGRTAQVGNVYPFDRHHYKDLPIFSGNYLDFPEFIELFTRIVHDADLDDSLKLSYLKKRLDKESLKMIRNYTGREYRKALGIIIRKYSGLSNVMTHINQKARTLTAPRHPYDIEGLAELIEQLRSIKSLFMLYDLDKGFEIEVFKQFYAKTPRWMSDPYMKGLGNNVPNLKDYLHNLDAQLKILRTKQMYYLDLKGPSYGSTEKSSAFRPKPAMAFNRGRNPGYPRRFANAVSDSERNKPLGRPAVRFAGRPNDSSPNYSRPNYSSGQQFPRGPVQKDERKIKSPCFKCSDPKHGMLYCPSVLPVDKIALCREFKLCLLCFKKGHFASECKSTYRCAKCKGKHSSFVCNAFAERNNNRRQFNNKPVERRGHLATVGFATEPSEYSVNLRGMYERQGRVNALDDPELQKKFISLDFKVGGQTLFGMLDTGASVNLFPEELAHKLKFPVYPCTYILRTPQGEFATQFATKVKVSIGCYEKEIEFLLYSARSTVILGMKLLNEFKIAVDFDSSVLQFDAESDTYIQLSDCVNYVDGSVLRGLLMGIEMNGDIPTDVDNLIYEYSYVFSEANKRRIGRISSEQCKLHLTSELPITLRPYRCTAEDQAIIDLQIDELLSKGLIRESTSPYSFPVVMVDKKDEGKKARLCINYIKLNEITESEHFPMPKIDDMKDLFLGASWFTTIDIASGFHHIEMFEADKRKTAFSTMNGHYEWNVMPFGLKNAPIVFQRVISNLLQKHKMHKFAVNYIDDIIIFSKSFEEHLAHLKLLFEMVEKENITLKLSKCQFAKASVVYLGFRISENQFAPLRSNTEAIEKAPAPKDLKSLRGFLGKINFYQKFIPNRAALLYPLYQLLKKGQDFSWGEEEQKAFDEVKEILTSYPVLRIFDPSFKTFLYTDASRLGLGAVLKQSDPADSTGSQFVIGYFSKSLTPYQANYSVTELELLAIISAIDYWHFYLIGKPFTVITDHMPLKAVGKIGKPNTRLFNWSIRLRQYDFKVEYRSGDKNQEADYLSRHPVNQLKEITEGIVCFVSEDEIINAQLNCDPNSLPKKVRTINLDDRVRYIYKSVDMVKDYLPDEFTKQVLSKLHLELGHLGYKQLELHFSRLFYNPHVQSIIDSIIKSCHICCRVKAQTWKFGTLGQIGPAKEPFEIVHIDTKSGFKGYGSSKDNLHLAIDAFTRFVWAVSSKTKIGIDFINLLNKIIAVQKPKMIVADNYPAIKGKQFQDFLRKHEIAMTFVAVNHPSANGIVERVNRTIVDRLRCKRLEFPKKAWSTHVVECIDEYNNSVHTATRYTPSFLLTGSDPDGLFSGESLVDARIIAFEFSKRDHALNSLHHDSHRRDPVIVPGEPVYVQAKHSLNRGMLDPRFEGPFPVVEKIGHTTYEVDKLGKKERYHVSQLKLPRPITLDVRPTTAVYMVMTDFDQSMFIPICLGGRDYFGIIDTGSTVNVLPSRVVNELELSKTEEHRHLESITGQFDIRFHVRVNLNIGRLSKLTKFLLSDQCDEIVLGRDCLKDFMLRLAPTKEKDSKTEVRQYTEDKQNTESVPVQYAFSSSEIARKMEVDEQKLSRKRTYAQIAGKPPVSIFLGTILLLLLFLFKPVHVQEITKTGPIVWKSTNHVAATGYNFSTHAAVLMSPCGPLQELSSSSNDSEVITNYLACRLRFEEVLALIKDSCIPVETINALGFNDKIHGKRHRRSYSSYSLAERENHLRTQLLREKRFVPLLIAGAIGGLISYGVMTSLHHYDNKGITDDTKAMSKQLGVDLDLLKRNNEQVQRYETMVNEALKKTWSQLDKVQIRFHDEVESSRMLTLALTTINEMKLNLERFFDSLILGKVSPAYNRLFPNNPFVQLSPLSYWTPHPCEFQAPNVMVMKYEVPKVSPSIKILEAEPFLILAKEDGKDCLKSYDGIKFIIWDTGNDCTRDLLKVPTHPSEVFLVQEDSYKCVDVSNRTQNWRTTYCEERVKKHQFVQMSVDEHFTYVYCYFHTLKVGDLDPIDCENAVYRFSREYSYFVDSVKHDSSSVIFNSTLQPVDSNINSLMTSRSFLPHEEINKVFSDLGEIIEKEKVLNNMITWRDFFTHPATYGSFSGILLIGLVLISIFFCCRRQSFRSRMRIYRDLVDGTTTYIRHMARTAAPAAADNIPMT